MENRIRHWNTAADWAPDPDGDTTGFSVPVAGEEREVESGWNMVYDVPANESVKLKMLTINGRLSFDDTADRTLKAEHIFVKLGELYVGNTTTPFKHKADIVLYGE